ncbi:hypothetical protein D9756_009518 [Leucocoprinus leucothites]|uniref:Terpene synthase n=1 Tax=Leucocoprinus leucothites TaxID=201217 RepID=A0A8H5CWY0_9AGAR|nr:hypothetical protein D9756_009518 [Leucoagaricus leucothites]
MVSASNTNVVTLPRILTQWPWTRVLSEHYQEAKAGSTAWVESFRPFQGRSLESFRKCDFTFKWIFEGLLASLTYSPREKELIRLGCDLMHLFFVFDEYTDVEDRQGVQSIHQTILDIFANPDKPGPRKDTCVTATARGQALFYHLLFWAHARAQVPEDASCLRHFLDTWSAYTAAVVQEADDRANKRYRSFDDYMKIRRNTAGGGPTLALIEFGLNIPDEVYYHPVIASLREKAEILIVLVNDMYSYPMEKSRGLATHNGVEILMRERNIPLQRAMDWLGGYCNELADGFLIDLKSVPSWGANVDQRVSTYINGLGQWVRGIDDWHFESMRYFGSEAPIVKQTRKATLIPPSRGYVSRHPRRGSTHDTL